MCYFFWRFWNSGSLTESTFNQSYEYLITCLSNLTWAHYGVVVLLLTVISVFIIYGSKIKPLLVPSKYLNFTRFWFSIVIILATYLAFFVALYLVWYDNSSSTRFHYFDDRIQWLFMDKVGHTYCSYFQSLLCYQLGRWIGMEKRNSMFFGIFWALLFQFTIEFFDGFSPSWGFSFFDGAFNLLGVGIFYLQYRFNLLELFSLKVSALMESYEGFNVIGDMGSQVNSSARTEDLFGKNPLERYLKDYNAQTYWMSINLKTLFRNKISLPSWLNIAFGYGAKNLYGGFSNSWIAHDELFNPDESLYPRTRQFFVAIDFDLRRIRVKDNYCSFMFAILNIFKLPTIAFELDENLKLKFHLAL